MRRLSLFALSTCILVACLYATSAKAFECSYYKKYSVDNSGNVTEQDSSAVPTGSNCLVVNDEGKNCYVKGYHSCPADYYTGDYDAPTRNYYTKTSCGYILNPISDTQQEFEYCELHHSTTVHHGMDK